MLGDKIYIRPVDGAINPLPSPNALKNKYLLRGKKIRLKRGPDKMLDQENDEPAENSNEQKDSIKLDPEFSRLISLPSVRLSANIFQDIDERMLLDFLAYEDTWVITAKAEDV